MIKPRWFSFFVSSCSQATSRPCLTPAIAAPISIIPSRLHAVISRNWDIVPLPRLAAVLGTDSAMIYDAGKAMGLTRPAPLTPEEIRRNVEMVLRRNWPLLPPGQIEGLLGWLRPPSLTRVDKTLQQNGNERKRLGKPVRDVPRFPRSQLPSYL